jgi:hypothetical protein
MPIGNYRQISACRSAKVGVPTCTPTFAECRQLILYVILVSNILGKNKLFAEFNAYYYYTPT